MAKQVLTGGCQCGAVRYSVRGPAADSYHCHCSICRKCHGAIFGTFSLWPEDGFTLERGADNLTTYDTSPGTHRQFCSTCGCPLLAFVDDGKRVVYVSTATLDGDADPGNRDATMRHIFAGSKVPWYAITDDLPRRDEY